MRSFLPILAVIAVIFAAAVPAGQIAPAFAAPPMGASQSGGITLSPDLKALLGRLAPIDGPGLTRGGLDSKVVVVSFFASWCPPCRAEMPDLQTFYEQFKDRATLIGIDLGQFTGLGSQKDAKDLLQDLGVTYPAGFTNDSSVVKDFKVLGMPTTIFIRADGTIFKKWSGALDVDTLAERTNAMLVQ